MRLSHKQLFLLLFRELVLQNYKFSKTRAKFLEKFISLHDILEK